MKEVPKKDESLVSGGIVPLPGPIVIPLPNPIRESPTVLPPTCFPEYLDKQPK